MTSISKYFPLSGKIVGWVLIFATIFAMVVPVSSVFAQPAPGGDAGGSGQEEGDDGTTCAVEKIGWILCPIIEGSAKASEWLYLFLAKYFLSIQPELFDVNSGTKKAWDQARNIANIMFVVAFLILVYSQVTGGLMTSYGMKRMLPRLIIAAIAVNLSFYICQGMVDVSNILGFNIKEAMDQIIKDLNYPQVMGKGVGDDTQTSSGNMGRMAIAALAAIGFVWILIALMGGVMSGVIIICLTIVMVLLLRKALVVLLIVVSPIAFVAYLLPNTEKFFKKWLNMFWQLLMVFPIIAALLGAGQLASGIVLGAGLNQNQSKECQSQGGEGQSTAQDPQVNFQEDTGLPECEPQFQLSQNQQAPVSMGLAAAAIAVAPLLFVWSVLKGALSAMGAIGGKVTSKIEGGLKSGVDSGGTMRKRYKESSFGQVRAAKREAAGKRAGTMGLMPRNFRSRKNYRLARAESIKRKGGEKFQENLADRLVSSDRLAEKFAGSTNEMDKHMVQANAQQMLDDQLNKQAQAAIIMTRDWNSDQLGAKITEFEAGKLDVNDPMLAAAIHHLGDAQDFERLEKAMDRIGTRVAANGNAPDPSLAARTLAQTLGKNGAGLFSGGQIAAIGRGDITTGEGENKQVIKYRDMVQGNLAAGTMSAEKMSTANGSIVGEASRIATGNTERARRAQQQLATQASMVLSDNILNKRISKIQGNVTNFSRSRNANGGPWNP